MILRATGPSGVAGKDDGPSCHRKKQQAVGHSWRKAPTCGSGVQEKMADPTDENGKKVKLAQRAYPQRPLGFAMGSAT
ncbi:hypothetical protein NDU88_005489 [Pleurodeles waltl]|uniref:Uncharacterized protein n=1 Tax=Pleurodeles waltl TaxID=8319 RepID=A0AAV7TUE1_PLEWA|nr:hypothetical protein NDU88_005489 [Pleurodeles waltl]